MKAYGDLGMAFNAFSLEYTPLQKELDRMGQNVDETSTELQEQVTASELLEEGIRICIDFCQAAKVQSAPLALIHAIFFAADNFKLLQNRDSTREL